jgi:hypothetical protein
MDNQRLEKWQAVLEDRVKPEILTLVLHRQVFWRVREIAQSNPELPHSYFIGFLQETYANSQAVGVRRLVDPGRQPVSLLRLLNEIESMCEQFTETWFIGLWVPDGELAERQARVTFREHFRGNTDNHLDPQVVGEDKNSLSTSVESVRAHVDTSLAHMDKSPTDIPTFAELHSAIDAIVHVFKKYYLLLTAASILLDKIPLDHNWETIFTLPWMEAPGARWKREHGIDHEG